MLDQLLNAAKGQIGDVLSKNDVSMDKADDIASLSGEAVKEEVLSQATSGNLDGIMSLFSGKASADQSNPIVAGITSTLTDKVVSSLGLESGTAKSIATTVIPMVVKMISSKFQSGDAPNTQEGLMDSLGMDSGNIMDQAKGMLGDKAKDMLGGGLGKLFG
jgi:hypothetical protein